MTLLKKFQAKEILYRNIFKDVIVIVHSVLFQTRQLSDLAKAGLFEVI